MIVGAIFDGAYAVIFGKFRDIIINKYIGLLNKLGGLLLVLVGPISINFLINKYEKTFYRFKKRNLSIMGK